MVMSDKLLNVGEIFCNLVCVCVVTYKGRSKALDWSRLICLFSDHY